MSMWEQPEKALLGVRFSRFDDHYWTSSVPGNFAASLSAADPSAPAAIDVEIHPAFPFCTWGV
jgi:hypothetical protein